MSPPVRCPREAPRCPAATWAPFAALPGPTWRRPLCGLLWAPRRVAPSRWTQVTMSVSLLFAFWFGVFSFEPGTAASSCQARAASPSYVASFLGCHLETAGQGGLASHLGSACGLPACCARCCAGCCARCSPLQQGGAQATPGKPSGEALRGPFRGHGRACEGGLCQWRPALRTLGPLSQIKVWETAV